MARRHLIQLTKGDAKIIKKRVGGPKKVLSTKWIVNPFPRESKKIYEPVTARWFVTFTTEARAARLKHRLSQSELANKLGVNQSAVSDFENGKSNPTAEMINRIVEALGMKITVSQ